MGDQLPTKQRRRRALSKVGTTRILRGKEPRPKSVVDWALLTSLIPSPLMESTMVRDRLLLGWDCRDM